MKKNYRTRATLVVLALCLVAVSFLTACGNAASDGQNAAEGTGLEGKISVIGSTSVQPLAQMLADEFNIKEPKVRIDIQGVGSTAGIKAINDSSCDIGMSSRELKEQEKNSKVQEHVIALDGIAIIVHPNNDVQNLSEEDIFKIFSGQITNWQELGGNDGEIIVVSREAGSGTRGAFEELLNLQKKEGDKTISLLIANALIAEGNGAVLANVAGKENAIGYMSLGMVDQTKVKKVAVNGVEATEQNIKDKKYSIARPLLMLTQAEPNQATKAYLDFILSAEGQKIVAEDYIPVN
ncbi:MAG: phosphate ABC transporter substrate-binding protein [Peptococcaceae bacterium]|nr:phosphate ABC transporter substrate-binding protein [Peptococcaceae bacterium]